MPIRTTGDSRAIPGAHRPVAGQDAEHERRAGDQPPANPPPGALWPREGNVGDTSRVRWKIIPSPARRPSTAAPMRADGGVPRGRRRRARRGWPRRARPCRTR